MKKSSTSQAARVSRATLSALLAASGALLLVMSIRALPTATTFTGTFDPHPYPCATTPNTFLVPPGQVRLVVNVNANNGVNDLAMTLVGPDGSPIHTEDNGVGQEVFLYQPGGGVPAGSYSVVVCASSNPIALQPPYDYTGTFTYDDTAGTPSCTPNFTTALPAAPVDPGPKVGYENFEAPGVLTPITQTSSGAYTYEYLGHSAIEPSIGVDWKTNVTAYQSDLETLFVTFGSNGLANWVNRRAPTSQFIDSDPILFTDRQTGRTFASELTLLSPDTVKISYTDDDGQTWVPDQTGGIASAVDHETIGGGPYHAPMISPPAPAYPNAVYYCSQDLETALCSRSDTGGLTYGPSVPMYVSAQCGGLHGHVKVAADGTVYVPNRDCGGTQSVVVSEDNGASWAIHAVNTCTYAAKPSLVGTGDDPALSVDASGRIYFAFSNYGTSAGVAVSEDKGQTWKNMYDVGAAYGVHNVAFPTATAGDAGRAAIAFYGSTTPNGPTTGDSNDTTFTGVWHTYVAHAFDGGTTWTTSDVTPPMPMRRGGLLRGTASGAETVLTNVSGSQTNYNDTTATDSTKTYYYKIIAYNKAGQSLPSNEVAAPYIGNTCDGLVIHQNDPSHPEAFAGGVLTTAGDVVPAPTPPVLATAVPQLLIDYISVAEPPSQPGYFVFKMKVVNLNTLPANSRWRIAWDYSPRTAPDTEIYYVGMTMGGAGTQPTFEYGTLADAGVPAVLLLSETPINPAAQGSYLPDGTITINVPKADVGNPQVGDLLGAIGGKTITGDTPETKTLERSTTFVDHTFIKGNSDNSYPAATYTVAGNVVCAQPTPSPTPKKKPH